MTNDDRGFACGVLEQEPDGAIEKRWLRAAVSDPT